MAVVGATVTCEWAELWCCWRWLARGVRCDRAARWCSVSESESDYKRYCVKWHALYINSSAWQDYVAGLKVRKDVRRVILLCW